ncbi:MAG: glycoside hydrolase family 97 protein [Verrucomicrobia bacterium]|nr:glycoside hydrolase family 97 protein [Verrucomicrobiota bacterium]
MRLLPSLLTVTLLLGSLTSAAEQRVLSPNGKLTLVVSDAAGLRYRVELDGKPLLDDSVLGLAFADGTTLGPAAKITTTQAAARNATWDNPLGQRRTVPDRFRELRINLSEGAAPVRTFGLIVRAYDDGVAIRYDLPEASKLGHFVLTNELTEFRFAGDYRCWFGEESSCAENRYPEAKLSTIPPGKFNTLPLLVETPGAYVAVAEADLLDWAGMFATGTASSRIGVKLASRSDWKGLVISDTPRVSPWRVLMIGRTAADLVNSDLIATLATPNRLGDVSWVKPGVCAWDPWWTGVNATMPQFTGLDARGDTSSEKEYIGFASEMGWPYQLMDWNWSKGDPTVAEPHMNVPEVFAYAKQHGVRMFVWMHSNSLKNAGFEKVFSTMEKWGAAGVKVDFMNSDSQETVQWYEDCLKAAAKHRLMVDFHGAYKPTGLARTYPNYITQEGVLGNEYNKLGGNQCTLKHTITLPFTRGLLGPMDFTPGGFVNRTPSTFKTTYPAQVMGTRARQLAMTVVYRSPLLVLCDSPVNYRGQPGVEFFRGLPTVWDESVVLSAEVGKHIVIARRSGKRWFIAAMNGEDALTLDVSLDALQAKGLGWTLREFADGADPAAPETVVETTRNLGDTRTLTLRLAPGGGYAATLSVKP